MTVTGKIQKFRMREMAIEELGLEQAAVFSHGVTVAHQTDVLTSGDDAMKYVRLYAVY